MKVWSLLALGRAKYLLPAASIVLLAGAIAFDTPGLLFGTGSTNIHAVSAEELGTLVFPAPRKTQKSPQLAISPDGVLLATGSLNGQIQLWETATRRPIVRSAHGAGVCAIAFFADAHGLLTAGRDHTVARWSLDQSVTPQLASRWQTPASATALALSSDASTAAVACGDKLELHNADTGELHPEQEWCVPGATIFAIAFAPDRPLLSTAGSGDNAIRIWGLTGGRPALQRTLIPGGERWVRGLVYSADGVTLVSIDSAGCLLAWDRDGQVRGEAYAGQSVGQIAALGGQARLVFTKNALNDPAQLWQLPEHWWH